MELLRPRTSIVILMLSAAILANLAGVALAHSGGLDGGGGHHCREAGHASGSCAPLNSYHCHSPGCVEPGGSSGTSGNNAAPPAPPPPPPDTTPPPRPKLAAPSVKNSVVSLPISAQAGSRITVSLDGSPVHTTTATGDRQTLSFSVPDGEHTLVVTATDAASNTSKKVKQPVVVDTRSPRRPSLDIPSTVSSGDVTLSVSGEPDARYTIRLTGDGDRHLGGRLDGTGTATEEITLINGNYKAAARLTDSAGNRSKLQQVRFAVTVPPPAAPQIELDEMTSDGGLSATITAEPDTTVVVELLGEGAASEQRLEIGPSGSQDVRFDVPEGRYTLTAVATDAQGQESTAARRGDIVVDHTAPKLSLTWNDELLAAGQFAYRITTEPGVVVTTTSSTSQLESQTTSDGESIEGLATVPPGRHTITVSAIDPAGNQTTEEFTAEVVEPRSGGFRDLLLLLLIFGGVVIYARREKARLRDRAPQL